jgi:hypothetical protein
MTHYIKVNRPIKIYIFVQYITMKTSLATLFNPLPTYLKRFVQEDFNTLKYLLIATFLGVTISINYLYNFEEVYVQVPEFGGQFVRYILFYGLAYYGTCIILKVCDKEVTFFRKPSFWALSFIGIVLISLDGSFIFSYKIAELLSNQYEFGYVGKLISELKNFFTLFIPLFCIWLYIKPNEAGFYGLVFKNAVLKPYFVLLLLMIPLIAIAAHDASFLDTYPIFESYNAEKYWNVPIAYLAIPYEFLYGLSFLNVELFFRGFLIIGMVKIMGKDSILPMVVLYAFLHFGKPLGETISSVFGGYLLGTFAYYSNSIWGGVIVHAGIALMMEFATLLV